MESPFVYRFWGWDIHLWVRVLITLLLGGFARGGDVPRHDSVASLSRDRLAKDQVSQKLAGTMRRDYPVVEHFAEIDVALSASLTSDDLLNMPHAPGKGAQLSADGTHVQVQLPAALVGDLIERGEAVTVLRDFMLTRPVKTRIDSDERTFAFVAGCAGEFIEASSATDHPIPEFDWAESVITIESAPASATVTCVDVHFEVVHPRALDVWLDLCNEDRTYAYTLRFMEGNSDENISGTVTGITAMAGLPVNQSWRLCAMDLLTDFEGYIDNWWIKVYYERHDDALIHDALDQPITMEEGVAFQSTTVGATGQYETRCGYHDVLDVWHAYTPTQTGLVSVRVESFDFDTTLAVCDASGAELACNDDDCDSTNSIVTMPMTEGQTYLLRVAGYDYETGRYTLTVDALPVTLATEPNQPSPSDGADVTTLPLVLSWNGATNDAGVLEIEPTLAQAISNQVVGMRTIYGQDDRLDEYEVTDPCALAVGQAAVMLVYRQDVLNNGDGTYRLQAKPFAWWYEWLDPIESGNTLCDDEPFRDQPSAGICSGVLVGADLVATAGHCVACLDPDDIAVVFDFVMEDAETAVATLRHDQVYWVREVLDHQVGSPDWGLLRLDRSVPGHAPLALRRAGRIDDGQPVLMVGYPWGLPRKYDSGAVVRENGETTFFQANLDTYRGSSGSPVVNLDAMEVEGLLVRGMPEFVEDTALGCDRSFVCPDGGCLDEGVSQWQDVTRATNFSAAVPVFDLYLGTDPDRLELVATDLVVPRYAPVGLRKEGVYYWHVVTRDVNGEVTGPLWSFRTDLGR